MTNTSWGALRRTLLGLAFAGAAACDGNGREEGVCVDGTTVPCICESNGHEGAKVCAGTAFGQCLCPSPTFEDSGADLASSDLASSS